LASVHALAPDHWAPLAALARTQGWSALRTARVTAACGFAHVTVSVVLGLIGLAFGIRIFDRFGAQLESFAGVMLIGFGVLYGISSRCCSRQHRSAGAAWPRSYCSMKSLPF
jgi:vacuolar-type H+-ATPase subunit I/STV1